MFSQRLYHILLFPLAIQAWWQPPAGTTWEINLSGILQPPYPANTTALDGDLYANTNASTWTAVRSANYKTICYFSAGSFENWRPDAGEFNNATDIGAPLDGWNGEWWLNTNSPNVRRIMLQRLDLAQKQGCDAVDPDNVDAYDNGGGGFNLTAADAVNYVKFLAAEAHERGMGAGLKNAEAIVPSVLKDVDFQVNEQCLQYQECSSSRPFIDAGKPVFEIEYTKKNSDKPSEDSHSVQRICTAPSRNGFSTLIKHMNLGPWGIACNITVATNVNATTVSNATNTASSSNSTVPVAVSGAAPIGGIYARTPALAMLISSAWLCLH